MDMHWNHLWDHREARNTTGRQERCQLQKNQKRREMSMVVQSEIMRKRCPLQLRRQYVPSTETYPIVFK